MPSGHASPGAVVAVVISMTVLACIFVGMRLYARLGIARAAGLDDLCIVLSMVCQHALGHTQHSRVLLIGVSLRSSR